MLLYIPADLYFGESPQHTFLDKTTFAMLTIGPDLRFFNPFLTAMQFWLIQSCVFLVVHILRFAWKMIRSMKKT